MTERAHPTAAVSLADEERVKQILVNSILGLWDVVNNLTRLKVSRRDRYRVTTFGSARVQPGFGMAIPRCVADADQAIALLRECHASWRANGPSPR